MDTLASPIRQLPTKLNAEQAWYAYQAMVIASSDDVSLRADREHCEATLRAWKRFSDLFLAMDQAA